MAINKKNITTSKKVLGKGSPSFLLGFNRYKLAEREYIIFYPKNYDLFLRTYANSFTKGMRESNIRGGAQGATTRYLNKATGLVKIQQISATGAALLQGNEELVQHFEERVMRSFLAASESGALDAINKYSGEERAGVQKARTELANNVTDTIFNIEKLGEFFNQYWTILTQASASPQATNAFKIMLNIWGTTHSATNTIKGLTRQDLQYLDEAAGFLNSITKEYDKLLGSIKTYKQGNKARGIKKGDSIVRDAHQASIDLVGYIQSLLSNIGGGFGEDSATAILNTIISNQVPYQLDKILDSSGRVVSPDGFINMQVMQGDGAKRIGTQKNEFQKTTKTDVVTPWLQVTSSGNGTTLTYEAKIAANVKSYPSLTGMTSKDTLGYDSTSKGKTIKIQETKDIYQYLKNFSPATARFYMENTLVHAASASEPMRLTKQTLAANFFNEWLAGTASRVGKSEIDLSNFLIVNNHIFSMYDVIQEIANSFNEDALTSAIDVSITGRSSLKNAWAGEKTPSYTQGFERSRSVLGQLSSIGLVAKMNPRVLFNVAAKYGISPIL